MKEEMSLTKQLTIAAILLAICIASQFFKNLSVYITGPIINLCLVMAVMTIGLKWGLILAAITPVTAFFIASSPVMQAVPMIIVFIILGNAVLVIMTRLLFKPSVTGEGRLVSVKSVLTAILSALAKGAFMGLTISLWLLPAFIPKASPLSGKMSVFQMMFSLTQFITAVIGFAYFFLIWTPVKKSLDK